MTWRPANSLLRFHAQVKVKCPRAAPPHTSDSEWGLIGDAAHDPSSDHSPHNFPGWGNEIVTAADFPNRVDLGCDAHAILDSIRVSRDPRAKYGISNAQIFSNHPVTENGHSYAAWEWRPYHGSDLHKTHGHLSVVGDARSDGIQNWNIGGIVPATGLDNNAYDAERYLYLMAVEADVIDDITYNGKPVTVDNKLGARVKRVEAKLDQLLARSATVALTDVQISQLAAQLAQVTDKGAIEQALRDVLKKGTDNAG